MATTKLGRTGPEVLAIGLGCMGMSHAYGRADEDEGVATIQAAAERGPVLIDTGDFYGSGHNERLVGRAIAGRRDKVVLSVKFGAMRDRAGNWLGTDTRPAAVKNFLAYSLDRLGVDHIDVYRPSRLDPNVPIEDTVGAIADMVKAGYVRHVGLSEVGAETVRKAAAVHPIVDLQIEYNFASRGPEATIFPALREVGASATIYSVFARGLLTGSRPGERDSRRHFPRFAGEHAERNASVVESLRAFAADRGWTPGQLAIAWVRARQPDFVPVIGAKTRAQWADALASLDVRLTADDLAAIDQIASPDAFSGTRYMPEQMRNLDSER